jgi:phosphatidylglycerol:prolipoprotein diacylglycerol transferase
MMPVLQLGPLAIQLPGLLLLLGVWIGSLTLDREAARRGLSADRLSKLVFFSLIVGLVSARLGYVLRYASAYAADPLAVISLSPQTLSATEGIVGAVLFAWVYGRRAGLSFWPTVDALTPMLAVFAAFLALAHVASGDAFGAPTDVPWAIDLWGARRHPSQIYELVAALAILGAVLALRLRSFFPGALFLLWVSFTAGVRVLLEAWRGDSLIILGGLRAAQLTSLAILLVALAALHVLARADLGRSASGGTEDPVTG